VTSIRLDPHVSDDERRDALYDGDILMYSERKAVTDFCEYAQRQSEEAFTPLDPRTAQFEMDVESYNDVLKDFKPTFINSPESKRHVQNMLTSFGCDPEKTYFDVPRIRTMTHGDYLRAGLAYQFHPHRDTWFSAPFQQLNWWFPVYEIVPSNTMAFHFDRWDSPVENSSEIYDYEEWKEQGRKEAADQVEEETREQPEAQESIDPDRGVPLTCQVGECMIFSAAHLHGTVENTSGYTRFSIDFRTVNIDDLESGRSAPNLDSECTGTTLGDYLRVSDLEPLPQDLIDRYDRERSSSLSTRAG
jgi:hypothetical protein